jgi:glycine cleavage system H protein
MTTHEFLNLYDAKVAEYLLAVTYLLLFVPMWQFVHGGAHATAHAAVRPAITPIIAPPAPALGWFHLPDGVALHAGHAWARAGADGLVTVGLDDFAQKLVDPERVVLPRPGDRVLAGQPAFAVGDRVTTVPVRAPVDGEVVSVNVAAAEDPARLRDPYGTGWLFKVKVPAAASRVPLMLGAQARDFLERCAAGLSGQLEPALGHVLQDGGTPVHGIARALHGDDWAALARRFLEAEEGR